MVSIKGITIKNVVDFLGHEQEPLVQCDVYYQGKKVAFYSQDSWGGEDRLDFDYDLPREKRQELENLFEKLAQDYLNERIAKGEKVEFYAENKEFYKASNLILEIVELKDIEKMYKKALKQNRDNLLAYSENGWELSVLTWQNKGVFNLDYVLLTKGIKKEQVRYYITNEKDFEIK